MGGLFFRPAQATRSAASQFRLYRRVDDVALGVDRLSIVSMLARRRGKSVHRAIRVERRVIEDALTRV